MSTTSAYINFDSPKYVKRTQLGMDKRGSRDDETDSAHILSFGLANVILTNLPGAPLSFQGREDFIRSMNSSSNLRIKSDFGNRFTDERNDAMIARAFVHQIPITDQAVAYRAVQAYEASKDISVPSIQEALGNIEVRDAETNRTHLVKNHRSFR